MDLKRSIQSIRDVPTLDMFFDTIYESRPGSSRLDKEAGYIMAEKLISMKQYYDFKRRNIKKP